MEEKSNSVIFRANDQELNNLDLVANYRSTNRSSAIRQLINEECRKIQKRIKNEKV